MPFRRTLSDREYGFELAGFEREIIKQEDVGFVVNVNRQYRYFRLAPSPFLKPYDTLYVVDLGLDVPPKGAFIRIRKFEKRNLVRGKEFVSVNLVKDWEFADFKPFLRSKPVFDVNDLWCMLKSMFKKPREELVSSIAIYLASSPPYDLLKGGLRGILIANKQNWTAYKRIFQYLIPGEFQRRDSPYYYGYQYGKVDPYSEPDNSHEVCIDYVNPKEPTYFHVPQPLGNVDTKPVKDFEDLFKDYSGGIAGYMLHYLHLQPKINNPELVNKRIEEIVLEIKRASADSKLPPDFTFLERIAKAVARLNLRETVKKDDLDFVTDVWLECYKTALRFCRVSVPLAKYYSLGKDAKIVYTLIKDLAVNDKVERRVVVEEGTKLFGDSFYVERIIEKLVERGFVYIPCPGVIGVVDSSRHLV